jgi:tRNA-uridine 2-sulfurtransferase
MVIFILFVTDLKLNDGETATYEVRIRYRQALQKATLHKKSNGLYVEFETPQKGITAGQFAAWYSQWRTYWFWSN